MTDPWRKSATDLAILVRSRQLSAKEVTTNALARLAQVNPAINAVVTEFPDEALKAAQQIDERLARGEQVGPLAGVPITIKVNVDQAGHATTNGLRIQRDLKAKVDNPVVANLRKAGAIIIDREGSSKTMRQVMREGTERFQRGAQVVIFPEGTRQEIGAQPAYKPGIAALYREAGLPEDTYFDVNARAVGVLIATAAKAGVTRVVHCSTVGVHGDVEHPPANENATFW